LRILHLILRSKKDAASFSFRSRRGDPMNNFDKELGRVIVVDNRRDECSVLVQCVQCRIAASRLGKD